MVINVFQHLLGLFLLCEWRGCLQHWADLLYDYIMGFNVNNLLSDKIFIDLKQIEHDSGLEEGGYREISIHRIFRADGFYKLFAERFVHELMYQDWVQWQLYKCILGVDSVIL